MVSSNHPSSGVKKLDSGEINSGGEKVVEGDLDGSNALNSGGESKPGLKILSK
jgi:hypothetical protein